MEEPLSLAKSIVKELKKGHPINIRPLITVLNKDRFVQSKNFKAWMDHYLRLTKPFNDWSPQERRDLLMISIGEQAASLFDLAIKKLSHQDPFEDAYNTLKDQFCLPQPQFLARIEFYNTKPKVGMKTLGFLRKLREKSVLCNFEERDKEIMKMLLSKTNDAEWLGKSVSENWTENNLEQGKLFARNLEQIALIQKKIRKCYVQQPLKTKTKKKDFTDYKQRDHNRADKKKKEKKEKTKNSNTDR